MDLKCRILVTILLAGIAVLGYFNSQQQQVSIYLEDELLRQAQRNQMLMISNVQLQKKLEQDSIVVAP
jgi:hypothetical protein